VLALAERGEVQVLRSAQSPISTFSMHPADSSLGWSPGRPRGCGARGILSDPEKIARPDAWIDGKFQGEPIEGTVDRLFGTASAEHMRSATIGAQKAWMSKKSDPAKADQLYLRLAKSTDAMRAAAKSYLRLAEKSGDSRQREILLECAAFFAQLADRTGDQIQGSAGPHKKNGSF